MGHAYQTAAKNLAAETERGRVFATKLSRKSKYGVRALVAIEVAGERCPCGAARTVGEAQMPEAFVERILGELRRAGFVGSRRSHGGGFRMRIATGEVIVLDVVEALDGDTWTSEPASSFV